MLHYIKMHMKHRSCAAATAVAMVLSAWYALGYFVAIAATKIAFVEKILQWAPQLATMLQFVSPRAWPINGFDLGFLLGIIQIYLTAKIITWAIVAFYERIHQGR